MNVINQIKDGIIGEFTGSVTVIQIILTLIVTFLVAIFIVYIYKKTFNGVVYSKSFALSIVLIAMITSLIITTINTNLALSLGMVGALSIVRFRTAIKEPVDTAFLFWAITAGIMTGANLYLVSIIGSLLLGLLYFLGYTYGFKMNSQYLFVLKYENSIDNLINDELEQIEKYKIKSKSFNSNYVELTFEINVVNNDLEIVKKFQEIDGVISASVISYQNDFGA